MRKFQHHVAVWGAKPSSRAGNYWLVSHGQPTCKHVAMTLPSAAAFTAGITSIELFPTILNVFGRIEPDGLRADWVKVGDDLKHAMTCLDGEMMRQAAEGEEVSDREVA